LHGFGIAVLGLFYEYFVVNGYVLELILHLKIPKKFVRISKKRYSAALSFQILGK